MPEQIYSFPALQAKIAKAVAMFGRRDWKLLKLDAHEQAIAHRIAIYLECQFKDDKTLNVDCEYNKHLEKAKRIDLDLKELRKKVRELEACGCPACTSVAHKANLDNKLFRPDIVVHSRGDDNRNIIVVEIKNTGVFCPFDGSKLEALTAAKTNDKTYQYQLGVFLSFDGSKPSFKWYSNGDPLPECSAMHHPLFLESS